MNKFLFLVLFVVVGCSGAKPSVEGESSETDLKTGLWKSTQFLGNFTPPKGLKGIAYHNPARYRSYSFNEAAGKTVDIWVRSSDGDAVAWLFDHTGKLIRYNDDADGTTTDAHIHVKLPASNGIYYLYFREYSEQDCTFQFSVGTAFDSGLVGAAEKAYEAHADNLDPYKITRSALPAKARATFDKWSNFGNQYAPVAYRLPLDNDTIYVVAQVGEEVYWLDLYASDGTFLTHGDDGDGGPGISNWGPAASWDPTRNL